MVPEQSYLPLRSTDMEGGYHGLSSFHHSTPILPSFGVMSHGTRGKSRFMGVTKSKHKGTWLHIMSWRSLWDWWKFCFPILTHNKVSVFYSTEIRHRLYKSGSPQTQLWNSISDCFFLIHWSHFFLHVGTTGASPRSPQLCLIYSSLIYMQQYLFDPTQSKMVFC